MPTAIRFDGAENTHTHADCFDLPTMVQMIPFGERKAPQVTSCWQFSETELETLRQNGGVVYVSIIGGQPPMSVSLENPKLEIKTVAFTDIAQRLKDELNQTRIVGHGSEGRVFLTFTDMQFDLSKEEWEHVQSLYADL